MNNIYIIIISEESNTEIMQDRIKAIGHNYVFWNNHWIVETSETAQTIYQKLSATPYEVASIFISELNLSNYYGRMKTSLWDWIKEVKR